MSAKVRSTEVTSVLASLSVDWNGWNFLVIYGKGSNGWFVAIPNWEVCIEAAPPDNTRYNAKKLGNVLNNEIAGEELAAVIYEHWRK